MILLDKPYISEYLVKTLEQEQLEVVKTAAAAEAGLNGSLNWIDEKEAAERVRKNPESLLLTNSENAIGWIDQYLQFSELPKQINAFKDKALFRELFKDQYPDLFFEPLNYSDLDSLDVAQLPMPFVIKPAVGFFSLGVHLVHTPDEWPATLNSIHKEIDAIRGYYPPQVLNTQKFIVEEIIEGTEYAVDCYYDETGTPIILNIFKHYYASGKDTNDRLYLSSAEIVEGNMARMQQFLEMTGSRLGLRNFVTHSEVRINDKGDLVPIEINPMRFGGWCTTADLSGMSYGINSYEYFLKKKKPDWEKVFEGRREKLYALIVLENSTGIRGTDIASFDYDRVRKNFENPLDIREVDYKTYPTFGFVFAETRKDNFAELERILKADLREYITLK